MNFPLPRGRQRKGHLSSIQAEPEQSGGSHPPHCSSFAAASQPLTRAASTKEASQHHETGQTQGGHVDPLSLCPPPPSPKPFPGKGDTTQLLQAQELPHENWCALSAWVLPPLQSCPPSPGALHRTRLLHTKVRDGQGAVSDWGAQLVGSYLQVTGRLFPITQVGKLRQGGSAGTRGARESGSGPVLAAPSLLSHRVSHLSTKLEAPVQTTPMGHHGQHPPTRLGGDAPGVSKRAPAPGFAPPGRGSC